MAPLSKLVFLYVSQQKSIIFAIDFERIDMEIFIEDKIKEICPEMQIGVIRANVVNTTSSDELWEEIHTEGERIRATYQLLEINRRPAIYATRKLYRALGKDPNRYRVSSEALCRRIIKGMELYHIDTLVDLINLASMHSGYAIGGFDADKIVGDSLTLGVGQAGEKFEGIGRGLLNIEGLPVYRDAVGGIGTPTSDEERTKMGLSTTAIHVNINAFAPEMPLEEMMEWTISLLRKYASATQITQYIVKP